MKMLEFCQNWIFGQKLDFYKSVLLTYWSSKTSQTFSIIGNTLAKSSHHNFTHVFGNFVFWNNIFIGQNISQETVIERNVKKLDMSKIILKFQVLPEME